MSATNPFENDYVPSPSPSRMRNFQSSSTQSYRNHQTTLQHPSTMPVHSIPEYQQHQLHPSALNEGRSEANIVGNIPATTTSPSSEQDSIWEARGIEWPLMNSIQNLSSSQFNKLYKRSKIAGNSLGITLAYDGKNSFTAGGGGGGGGGTPESGGSSSGVGGGGGELGSNLTSGNVERDSGMHSGLSGVNMQGSEAGGGGGGYYGALGGFMGKLIGQKDQNLIGKCAEKSCQVFYLFDIMNKHCCRFILFFITQEMNF